MKGPRKRNIPQPTNFGSNLKYLRKLMGISQSKLAAMAELNRNNIASYETGLIEPKAVNFIKICDLLEVDPFTMLDVDLSKENIIAPEKTDEIDDLHYLALDQIEKLSEETHEMSKILEGYQTFQEIHDQPEGSSAEIEHLMKDALRLFENLIETNWGIVNDLISFPDQELDSEE